MKNYKDKVIVLGLIFLPFLVPVSSIWSQTKDPSPSKARVDRLFSNFNKPDCPGVVVLVMKDGKSVYNRGFGSANLEKKISNSSSTVFNIASVSKMFTGMAIAMLVKEGKISLDDDIRNYMPEMHDFGKKITIRHLVHHTSGIRCHTGTIPMAGLELTHEKIIKIAKLQRALNFEPGVRHLYSNTGYSLLAEIVQRVTGQSFRQWTSANIFEPLEMTQTHFKDNPNEFVKNKAQGYVKNGDNFVSDTPGIAIGASSLLTTTDDLEKWIGNYFGEAKVGGPEVIKLMGQRGVLNDGKEFEYAFGLRIGNYRSMLFQAHWGSTSGFRSALFLFPKEKFAVVVLSNDGTMSPIQKALQITDIYFPNNRGSAQQIADVNREKIEIDPKTLEAYTGEFWIRGTNSPIWTITRNKDQLYLREAPGKRETPMIPLSKTEFQALGDRIEFIQNKSGKITQITIDDRHGVRYANRIERWPGGSTGLNLKELTQYVGSYCSSELGATYTISANNNQLVAQIQNSQRQILLEPAIIKNLFIAKNSSKFSVIEFVSDKNGHFKGLYASPADRRAQNVWFQRVEN